MIARFLICSGREISLLNYSIERIQKLELPPNIYKRKTILIKQHLIYKIKCSDFIEKKSSEFFSKMKSVLERLSIVFLLYKCSRSETNAFSLCYRQQESLAPYKLEFILYFERLPNSYYDKFLEALAFQSFL